MDVKQIKLLYEKLYNSSEEIEQLITKHEYEEAFEIVKRREFLTTKLKEIQNEFPDESIYPEEIKILKEKLKVKEQKNLQNLIKTRNFVKVEVDKTEKQKKLLNAYSQTQPRKSQIVDISE